MKTCGDCGGRKELDAFPKATNCVDGRRSYCKACESLRKSAYYQQNKTARAEWQKQWNAANPAKVRAAKRTYNRKLTASGKAAANKRRCWAAKPEKYRSYTSARRTKLRQATPPWVDVSAIRDVYEEAIRRGLTVDHITPINGKTVSGLHVPWNLQLLTLSENSRKRNTFEGDEL